MRKLKLIAGAYALLAIAYPVLIPPVLSALGFALAVLVAVAGWILANLPVALTLAAGVLLVRAFPGVTRWLSRAWDSSIDAILPVKA
ncbi:hypothetical protein ACIBAC_00130 [Streptomyces sp. NPDC051362]|uniref:hypothetical protein n=1 Tax=Streptomyces sp. NPDC051362 TaxID=3365651 RepID=UPI0037B55A9E